MIEAELVWDCRCRLGEGTVWNAADASLYFVDIKGREVLAYTPANGAQRRWALPHMIGWLVPREQGGWLAGFQQGVAALQLEPEVRIDWLHRLHEENSPMRLNDAKADAHGRLWFGSMNDADEKRPDGKFYRWSAGSAPVQVDAGYGVTNGPTFSADGRTLYHTDSVASTIYAFDLAPSGELSAKRQWVSFSADEGFPDGMTTDANGAVWVAHWAGSRVTQRDAKGRVVRTIDVAAPRVTNAAFGGPQLADLYITTARAGLDDAGLTRAPNSGGLFVARGAGRGVMPHRFRG
jgi:xylono-1,5-lactonase